VYKRQGMTGPQTLQKLRAMPSLLDVPVIFMTARVHPEHQKELWEVGALSVITKPFDPMSLRAQIMAALAQGC